MSLLPLIEAKNLTYRFQHQNQELTILNQLNFSAYAGQSLAIVGPSGSGKSSLLALLAGLTTPTFGEVLLQGEAFSSLSSSQRALKRKGFLTLVFQSFQLLPELTALENVLLALELNPKISQKQALHLAKQKLVEVGLEARLHHKPHQLSGGEQQRVALARAFVVNPSVLLADEPTGNLDAASSQKIADLLFNLVATSNAETPSKCLILVTHSLELAARCQRQFKLLDGQLVELNPSHA